MSALIQATSSISSSTVSDRSAMLEIDEDLIRRFNKLGPRYTSYPSADRFHTQFSNADYIAQLQARAANPTPAPLSVYVHLPFCASLCYYCACNKVVTKDRSRSAVYLQYLEKELALLSQYMPEQQLTTQLHLGGGTPTFLSQDELAQLMQMLRKYLQFTPDAELGIEIDPRTIDAPGMQFLASLGFNRTSLGVQDFDAAVQQAVHRVQPLAMVQQALQASREHGFESVNFDLIYGLPKQTLASFDATLSQVIALAPDRIALYNYAHLPSRFKPQRRILEADLPSAEQRLQIFMLSLRRLLDAGYQYIGLDHFAKPDDSLAKAMHGASLHRNFQGYTTQAECDLLALGVSAIGKLGNTYSQSLRSLDDYYAALDAGQLPLEKGFLLSQDDILRRHVIMDLMCCKTLDFAAIQQEFGIDFRQYFAPEIARLEEFVALGLITLDDKQLAITPRGRMFVRAVAMVFDDFLNRSNLSSGATYSKVI